MDDKGPWMDNVFVERISRSVKHKEIYLRACDNLADARANLSKHRTYHNTESPHQALDGDTQTGLTSIRHNQSRLRHKSGSHPLFKTADLSKQTEPPQ